MKSLMVAAAAACFATPAIPQDVPAEHTEKTFPSPYRGSFEEVPQILCQTSRGSGVRVSDDIIITARHVVGDKGPCSAYGAPVEIAHISPGKDLVAVRGDFPAGFRAIYSCEGIVAGRDYFAYGYAHGGAPNVEHLIGTNQRLSNGEVILRGRVFPGMSGGKVATPDGAFVAITVRYDRDTDIAVVVELKDTYLCQH